jgi:methylation protein EvaC
MNEPASTTTSTACRVCGGALRQFLDLGMQPISERFLAPDDTAGEFFYPLAVGQCASCTMVQLVSEVPRHLMFHAEYPFYSGSSSAMREHFAEFARLLLATELTRPDALVVELGCNDGIMLGTVAQAGVRHLGFEPSAQVAEMARAAGVQVRVDFFEESTARQARAEHGPAAAIYAANTLCHIPYLDSVFLGVDALLDQDGVFIFEDPYLGDIVAKTSFDQIYDEHFYLFAAESVRAAADRFGFELVDVKRLPVHGGEVRYTLARKGARQPSAGVRQLLAEESATKLADPATLSAFAANVSRISGDLVETLTGLRAAGRRVVGYGATAKSATVTNFCGIGPELVSFISDTTPAKQNLVTPGMHIPVRPPEAFSDPYPDYALLFAWNHAGEIMAKEQAFREAGGRWLLYVPDVHVI